LAASVKPPAPRFRRWLPACAPTAFTCDPSLLLQRNLNRAADPLVDEVLAEHPHLVEGWAEADFDELHSRVGAGGGLTRQGALDAIRLMNRKREVLRKVAELMETAEAELVEAVVEVLYRRVADGEA